MSRKKRLEVPLRVKRQFEAAFDETGILVFSFPDLRAFFYPRAIEWGLSRYTTIAEFIEYATKSSHLKESQLEFPNRKLNFYTWRGGEPFQIFRAIGRTAYLSHFTAALLHGLTEDISKIVFVSAPQEPKREPPQLTSADVHAAMLRAPRLSRNSAQTDAIGYLWLQPQVPGEVHSEIVETLVEGKQSLRVSTIEKLLIDSVIQPAYVGGIQQLPHLFSAARGSVSSSRLNRILSNLRFAYPYTQVLGYFMDRAGFGRRALSIMRRRVSDTPMFIERGDPSVMNLDPNWNVYVPQSLMHGP